jgi:hypothetical protein
MNDETNTSRLRRLADIAYRVLPKYEIRGVFRSVDLTPAGPKVTYAEKKVGDTFYQAPVGGVLLVCPGTDRTNGEVALEISSRDSTIYVLDDRASEDAAALKKALRKRKEKFNIV